MPTIPRLLGALAVVVDLLLAPLIDDEASSVLPEPVLDVELGVEAVPEELAAPVDAVDPVEAVPVLFASASTVESGALKVTEPMSSVIRRRTAVEIWALSIRSRPAVSYRQCKEIAE